VDWHGLNTTVRITHVGDMLVGIRRINSQGLPWQGENNYQELAHETLLNLMVVPILENPWERRLKELMENPRCPPVLVEDIQAVLSDLEWHRKQVQFYRTKFLTKE